MAISARGLVTHRPLPHRRRWSTGKFDPRAIVTVGFIITHAWRSRASANIYLGIDFWTAISWRAVLDLGLPFLFVPINLLCYSGIPQHKQRSLRHERARTQHRRQRRHLLRHHAAHPPRLSPPDLSRRQHHRFQHAIPVAAQRPRLALRRRAESRCPPSCRGIHLRRHAGAGPRACLR